MTELNERECASQVCDQTIYYRPFALAVIPAAVQCHIPVALDVLWSNFLENREFFKLALYDCCRHCGCRKSRYLPGKT